MKLVTLEKINGAILLTSQTEMTFRRMDNVSLGESWPVERTDKMTLFDKMYEEILAQSK